MSQDVIKDRYARLFEIPNQLSKMNVELNCICLSYQGADQGTLVEDSTIKWLSYNFFPTFGLRYLLTRL
jgi:hypothetical protein